MFKGNLASNDHSTGDNARGEKNFVAPPLPPAPKSTLLPPPPPSVSTPPSAMPVHLPPKLAAKFSASLPKTHIDTEFEPTNTGFAPGAIVERRPWNKHVRSKPRKTARWFADKMGILHLRQPRGRLSKLERTNPSALYAGARVRNKLDGRLGKIANNSPYNGSEWHGHHWVVRWDRKSGGFGRQEVCVPCPNFTFYWAASLCHLLRYAYIG